MAADLVKQHKENQYIDTLMDVLDDEDIKKRPEYTFNAFSSSSPDHSVRGTSPDSRPGTANSILSARGNKTPPPPKTPREFVEHHADQVIPRDEALNPDSTIDYTKYVGYGIQEQVAEGVREWAKYADGPPDSPEKPFSRCVVCTLPFGACEHTRAWLNTASPTARRQQDRNAIDEGGYTASRPNPSEPLKRPSLLVTPLFTPLRPLFTHVYGRQSCSTSTTSSTLTLRT